ncbi:MAG: FecR domain-containing protein [Spirochaetes bacterium]|jgi:hypothetical protein|nr:FecR domain-containing protein [Spirochaetota bacterium]
MKKIALIVVLAVFFYAGCKKESGRIEGTVNFISGDVNIVIKGKKTEARMGDAVSETTIIETGAKSQVDVLFEGKLVSIGESTSVEFRKLAREAEGGVKKYVLFMESGSVFSKLIIRMFKEDEYQVKTPTVVASVRGTEFLVTEGGGKATVSCTEGIIELKKADGTGDALTLKAGEKADIFPGKALRAGRLTGTDGLIADARKRNAKRFSKKQPVDDGIKKPVPAAEKKSYQPVRKPDVDMPAVK